MEAVRTPQAECVPVHQHANRAFGRTVLLGRRRRRVFVLNTVLLGISAESIGIKLAPSVATNAVEEQATHTVRGHCPGMELLEQRKGLTLLTHRASP